MCGKVKELGHMQILTVIRVGRYKETRNSESFVVPGITWMMVAKPTLANSTREFGQRSKCGGQGAGRAG